MTHPCAPRLSELGRMYGYNPSPPKLEGIQRPPSKTAQLQSRRHSLPAPPGADVSAATPAPPFGSFRCRLRPRLRLRFVVVISWGAADFFRGS